MASALHNCGWLTAAAVGLWVILAGPAFLIRGVVGLEGLTLAALLCLVPGWLVFLFGSRYLNDKNRAMVLLAGTVVRLLFVLMGVLCVQSVWPHWGFSEFLVWVLVFYLVMLFTETLVVIRQSSS